MPPEKSRLLANNQQKTQGTSRKIFTSTFLAALTFTARPTNVNYARVIGLPNFGNVPSHHDTLHQKRTPYARVFSLHQRTRKTVGKRTTVGRYNVG